MIINDLDGYYIVFDTKNWNTELDTLEILLSPRDLLNAQGWRSVAGLSSRFRTHIQKSGE